MSDQQASPTPPDAAPPGALSRTSDLFWSVIGVGAVLLSCWLLFREIHNLSWADVETALEDIPGYRWVLAGVATVIAYAALAWYDRIALDHLGFRLSWRFISAVSFTTYALSHSIGMTMFSGAMVRYRAYSTRGLTVADVGVLVAFCSFTFFLGTLLLGGLVCLIDPGFIDSLVKLPPLAVRLTGAGMLGFVALYFFGSGLGLPPLRFPRFRLAYPRPGTVLRQILAGPLELLGAAGIIYFALPAAINPGFLVVLGVFLASFSAALVSHAPGGLGVLELVFLNALPDVPQAHIIAALLVFRLLYFILPLTAGIVLVVLFERGRMRQRTARGA